jgi:nitrite reductase/ring-hydroxylating ferredoxin subunit
MSFTMSTEAYLKKEVPLCGLNDLDDHCAMELMIEERQLFAVRQDNDIFAYWNLCPHRNTPLNWVPNQFLDAENQLIQCALHGALFEIDSGLCIHGPCSGESLQTVELRCEDQFYFIIAEQKMPPPPINLRAQALADLEDKE